ncbi:ABC transporter ATP-binding protein [Microbacterium sp. cf332]|uniref:ABC transporter ATP-binding protein n=1 Tax=Microbacterium sp. cf332 TaxID=1761804 RepID=UPI00088D809A|nr:ABC transporter ATP-binding protein [Microbacterium sp. cf332]SDQ53165.1 peptide/nickel transport system ATP-binding protein [Microbacterium sp. cf332]
MNDVVLSIDDLRIDYASDPVVHAVAGVSFELKRGEILGIAGESGCGKTTLAYGITQLLKPPAELVGGSVLFRGGDESVRVDQLEGGELRAFRWDKISMVFQGAMNALNPVLRVRAQLEDVLTTHRPAMTKPERRARCEHLMRVVGVPVERLDAYAHELSGGMRQRVMIAMALLLDPPVMIMDEPTTALDVVVQREIIAEITRLRDELGFAVIFITHDLPLLLEISDRIAIMRRGEIVELAPTRDIYHRPQDPYTRELLAAFPSLTGERLGYAGATTRTEEDA